ncbi:MAG: hypothetical protein QGG36_23190 [Pirellulaceae bacterium]|jgi:hypothetical protein|nr:hypothetical protein [Pirellulaceae bacterium]
MGSFANSWHVKCEDPRDVVRAVEESLISDGFQSSAEEPDDDAMWGMPSPHRALHISDPHRGWIGVLDSDMLGSTALAAEVSQRLQTCCIHILVNDSDSWHYVLYRSGLQHDAFDSSGGAAFDFPDDDLPLDAAPDVGQLRIFRESMDEIEQGMQDLHQQLDRGTPDDIVAIQNRVETGEATPEDYNRLAEWIQSQAADLTSQFDDLIGGGASQSEPTSTANAVQHFSKLTSILPDSVTDEQLGAILSRRAIFAEEVLGDFLELIGVQPFFANLSYRYLRESTEAELAEAAIRLFSHLKYKTDSLEFEP